MIDIEDAIREALHADAGQAPVADESFVPTTAVVSTPIGGPSRRPLLVGAAAAILIIGVVWVVSGRDAGDNSPAAQTTSPSTAQQSSATRFHVVLDDPAWTITMAQINSDQVSSSYRNDTGSDDVGRPAVVITTGRAAALAEAGFDRSPVDIDGVSGTLYTRTGLAIVIVDLGDGRLATIAFEQVPSGEVDSLVRELHFVTDSEFESAAASATIPVQR